MNADLNYRHIQRAPLCLLVYLNAVIALGAAWLMRDEPVLFGTCLGAAMILFIVGASFHHLSVVGDADQLRIRLGPLPLFRRNVNYSDIRNVKTARTTLLDGWGIHYGFQRGWVWNIWGRDCVELQLKKGILRIGSDDAEALADYVRSRLTESDGLV